MGRGLGEKPVDAGHGAGAGTDRRPAVPGVRHARDQGLVSARCGPNVWHLSAAGVFDETSRGGPAQEGTPAAGEVGGANPAETALIKEPWRNGRNRFSSPVFAARNCTLWGADVT